MDVRSLDSENVRLVVLHFIVRFDGESLLQRNDLCWLFVDAFLLKTIDMCLGEDHPSIFPLL